LFVCQSNNRYHHYEVINHDSGKPVKPTRRSRSRSVSLEKHQSSGIDQSPSSNQPSDTSPSGNAGIGVVGRESEQCLDQCLDAKTVEELRELHVNTRPTFGSNFTNYRPVKPRRLSRSPFKSENTSGNTGYDDNNGGNLNSNEQGKEVTTADEHDKLSEGHIDIISVPVKPKRVPRTGHADITDMMPKIDDDDVIVTGSAYTSVKTVSPLQKDIGLRVMADLSTDSAISDHSQNIAHDENNENNGDGICVLNDTEIIDYLPQDGGFVTVSRNETEQLKLHRTSLDDQESVDKKDIPADIRGLPPSSYHTRADITSHDDEDVKNVIRKQQQRITALESRQFLLHSEVGEN